MVIDAEKAFIDYLEDNYKLVIGHGNATITAYRNTFPDEAGSVAISVFVELREGHESVDGLELIAVRINVRADTREKSFILAKNVDKLLDRMVGKNLNDDVRLMICRRNAGPSPFRDENDGLYYNTTLYSATIRYRGDD